MSKGQILLIKSVVLQHRELRMPNLAAICEN